MGYLLSPFKKYIWGCVPYSYHRLFNPKSHKIKYLKFIKERGYTHYPYEYADKYINMNVDVLTDGDKGLSYVMHRGCKKLYFPRDFTAKKIVRLYRSLMIEQDMASCHHYVDSIQEFEGKTLIDIGSAEGLTSLDAIEAVNSIVLFECDPRWIEALEATFEPWKEKVQICRNYISDNNDGQNQTLDNFFQKRSKENIFLKMDIEGEERNALAGAASLFSTANNLDFAICTYHRKDDDEVISCFLNGYDCTFCQRKGLLFYKHSLRPCLIRGNKR